jgi:hypothetical protein
MQPNHEITAKAATIIRRESSALAPIRNCEIRLTKRGLLACFDRDRNRHSALESGAFLGKIGGAVLAMDAEASKAGLTMW